MIKTQNMKKIYACMAVSLMALTVNAQTLTQATHAPTNGDMYSTKRADSVNIAPGAAGAGVTWNFGTLNIFNNLVANYTVMPSSTPGYPVGSQVAAASVNDQSYYVSSAADLLYYGGNFKVQTVNGSFTYTSPAVSHVYPMSLNSTSTAAVGGSINVPSLSMSGTFTGTSKALADGSGTLILPGGAAGTYSNVLRVVTSQTLNFTASFSSGTIIKLNYDFYTPSVKAPLLSIAMFSLTAPPIITNPSTQTVVTVNKDYLMPTVSIEKNKTAEVELSVFPNPSSSLINFVTADKSVKEVRIFDLTGKLVETKTLAEGGLKLDVSAYNKGVYLYSLLNQSGETVKTGKLTVN
jgi:hypothetical protein